MNIVLFVSLSQYHIFVLFCFFFFQAEDGIRDVAVTGVQTCALPICVGPAEVQERMRKAAYLVLPALSYQPVPRPVIEAFACSVPVIASRIGMLAEIIEPGRNGLLLDRKSVV